MVAHDNTHQSHIYGVSANTSKLIVMALTFFCCMSAFGKFCCLTNSLRFKAAFLLHRQQTAECCKGNMLMPDPDTGPYSFMRIVTYFKSLSLSRNK